MNEPRTASANARSHGELAADLEALRRDTERDPVSIDSVVRTASRRPRTWEEYLMATFGSMTRRPWIPAALAGALAVIALCVVPVSYEQTTGHAVALTVRGGLDQEHLRGLAQQMKSVLHSDGVTVDAEAANGGVAFTLGATVPVKSGIDAAAAAESFRAQLAKLGYDVTAKVTPVRERVTTTGYAYAMNRVIKVEMANKSAAEVENEIRQGLLAAGIENPQVSVEKSTTADGKDKLKVEVKATRTSTSRGSAPEVAPEILLTKNGVPVVAGAGDGFTVREEIKKTGDGSKTLTIDVHQGPKSATINIEHPDTIGDAALKSQVESQLAAAGIQADVTIIEGRVMLQPKK